jgi:hypothetical protein
LTAPFLKKTPPLIFDRRVRDVVTAFPGKRRRRLIRSRASNWMKLSTTAFARQKAIDQPTRCLTRRTPA